MRKILSKIHLWLSIPFGIIICIICLTGAILVFENEITAYIQQDLFKIDPPSNAKVLSPSELSDKVNQIYKGKAIVTTLSYSQASDKACSVILSDNARKTIVVNPYTGEIIGTAERPVFLAKVRYLHRYLLNPPAVKGEMSVGKFIIGCTALIMAVILITGFFIWIPRQMKSLKMRLSVQTNKGWRRFWYDSHVALGFYSCLLLLIMALTGLTWSFKWYSNAVYGLFGESTAASSENKASNSKQDKDKKQESGHNTFNYTLWNNAMADLTSAYPSYQEITLTASEAQIVTQNNATDKATFNPQDGHIAKIMRADESSDSPSLKGLFYSLHTGTWGGIWSKILYFLAALIGFTLPLTGYYLWWKKRSARKKRI